MPAPLRLLPPSGCVTTAATKRPTVKPMATDTSCSATWKPWEYCWVVFDAVPLLCDMLWPAAAKENRPPWDSLGAR